MQGRSVETILVSCMIISKIYKAGNNTASGDIMKKTETTPKTKKTAGTPSSSKDEQIGFHKGSLSTLAKERAELARILQIVEQLMQMHVAALNELGVDLQKEVEQLKSAPAQGASPGKKKPIEDVL